MAIRSSAAALLKQLQSDLTAVMGQKAAPTSDLPRTVLALLDKFTEMTRGAKRLVAPPCVARSNSTMRPPTILSLSLFPSTVKPIGRQDLLTVLSVVNYIFDKIPHVIGTLAMTLSLLQKVLKLYMALGDKNRAASLSALTLILKLPLLQGGEVRRCLFRDLLHGAMELLLGGSLLVPLRSGPLT